METLTLEKAKSLAFENSELTAWSAIQPVQYNPMFEKLNQELEKRKLRTIEKKHVPLADESSCDALLKQPKETNAAPQGEASDTPSEGYIGLHTGQQGQVEIRWPSLSRSKNEMLQVSGVIRNKYCISAT